MESGDEQNQLNHRRRWKYEEFETDGADTTADFASIEKAFESNQVPTWREQLTVRAFVVSFVLAAMFSVIAIKLDLTTGIIPSLNVSAGLLGYFLTKSWTSGLEKIGILKQPFTRQENTVIQTCVVAAYGIAFSGNSRNRNQYQGFKVDNNSRFNSNSRNSMGGPSGRGRGRFGNNKPRCQICERIGHTAIRCYSRFNTNITASQQHNSNNYQRNYQPQPNVNISELTQDQSSIISDFQANQTEAVRFDDINDDDWYPDSGATNHVTSNLKNLNLGSSSYQGGFGSYLFGMSQTIAKQSKDAKSALDIKEPQIGWMIGFLFVVSFVGLFCLVPLRKIMIIDYKLIYPSGTATAILINGFHTPNGSKIAKKQVKTLGKFVGYSFFWGFFQWFYTAGDDCGFGNFPTLGLKAYKNNFYFDFSSCYVGAGMLCPYIVNVSVLLGGILSWGIMWPLISNQKGNWYTAEGNSLHGIQGYRIFIGMAMILGDGLYNFVKVLGKNIIAIYFQTRSNKAGTPPISNDAKSDTNIATVSFDDKRRTELFMKDQIPLLVSLIGYVVLAVISIFTLPHIFTPLKSYHILVVCILAPVLAFCNAYGYGLTDWSLASTYGKLAIFTIGAWAGAAHGGVIAGLAACGVMMSIVYTASDLMQNFKTGYLTLASPRSMFISQVIGTAMGCVITPCVFWLFYKAFKDLGLPGTEYPAPYALVYRNIAISGVEGFGSLPKHCLTLCYIFFTLAVVVNLIKDLVPSKYSKYIPLPMAMAIPFNYGSYFAIDMFIGSVILFVWERFDKEKADAFAPAVASGLICGDGIWNLPQSILDLMNVKPPICMKFLSRAVNIKFDNFLNPPS